MVKVGKTKREDRHHIKAIETILSLKKPYVVKVTDKIIYNCPNILVRTLLNKTDEEIGKIGVEGVTEILPINDEGHEMPKIYKLNVKEFTDHQDFFIKPSKIIGATNIQRINRHETIVRFLSKTFKDMGY